MDWAGIQTALTSWITTSTGLQTVWLNQVRPQTPRPFATLEILNLSRVGFDSTLYNEIIVPILTPIVFTIRIDSVGATDTFEWQKNSEPFVSGIPITGFNQSMSNGMMAQFNAMTGHTLGDTWTLSASTTAISNAVFAGTGLDDLTINEFFFPDTLVQLQPTTWGTRALTVRVRFISRDQRPGHDAIFYAERASISIRRPFNIGNFHLAGLVYLEDIIINIQDAVFDERMESIAVLDIKFNVADSITIDDEVTSYIKKVDIEIETSPDDIAVHQIFGDINGT